MQFVTRCVTEHQVRQVFTLEARDGLRAAAELTCELRASKQRRRRLALLELDNHFANGVENERPQHSGERFGERICFARGHARVP